MKFNLMTTTKTLLVLTTVAFGLLILPTNSSAGFAGSPKIPAALLLQSDGDGAKIYAASCARCHGSDGQAKTGKGKQTGAVDLTSDEWEPDDARDTRIITKGKGRMPGFKNTLKPNEIKAVAVYIRRFKG